MCGAERREIPQMHMHGPEIPDFELAVMVVLLDCVCFIIQES